MVAKELTQSHYCKILLEAIGFSHLRHLFSQQPISALFPDAATL